MKRLTIKLFMILFCSQLPSQITVEGFAFLEGKSVHDSIMVVFERTVPDSFLDTTYTDVAGYYYLGMSPGIYNIKFSKFGFYDSLMNNAELSSDQTIETIELKSWGLFGTINGILEAGEYIVSQDIIVEKEDSLIIESGAFLYFQNSSRLIVRGYIEVNGAENDSILFTNDNGHEWRGIIVESDADSTGYFNYVIIEDSEYAGLTIESGLSVRNSTIRNVENIICPSGSIVINNSSPAIANTSIISNRASTLQYGNIGSGCNMGCSAIRLVGSSSIFSNCNISNNSSSGNPYTTGAIYSTNSSAKFENCIFKNNRGITSLATVCYAEGGQNSVNTSFENCIFVNNVHSGYNISGGILYGNATVKNCVFYENYSVGKVGYTAVIRGGSIYNTIFYKNDGYAVISGDVNNCLFYENSLGDFSNDLSGAGSNYIVNSNGDSCDFYYNIFLDPLLYDPDNYDFHVTEPSPVIDAGNNELINFNSDREGNIRVFDGNFDGDPIVDIGPYEYGAPFLEENDVSILGIASPLSRCGMTDAEQVSLKLKNYGTVGEKGFPVSYSTDGGSNFVTEIFTDSLAPGAEGNFTFAQTSDFSSLGECELIVAISVPGDATPVNDTLRRMITHYLLEASIIDSTNITCFGEKDGTAKVEASGAPGPYYYQWDDNFARNTPTVTGLRANELYTVDVTTTDQCHTTTTVMLTQPEALSMNLLELNKATCNSGLDDGSVTVEAVGGIAPYLYQWDDQAATTGPVLENMAPNIWYHILITDANGCMVYDSVKVTEANQLVTSFPRQQDVSCYGEADGMAEVAIYFGTEPYSYLWNDAAGSKSRIINDLTGGRYYRVSVMDDIGCTALDSVFINEPDSMEASYMLVHNKCFGEALGGINLTVSGGTEPYNFYWSDGSETEDIVDLPYGEYIIRITDANSCIFNDTAEVLAPEEIQVNFEVTDVSCHGLVDAVVNVEVSGGSPDYLITWPDDYLSPYREGVAAGTYLIQVRDENECTKEASVTVNEPEMLELECLNGEFLEICEEEEVTLELFVSGGTPQYEMEWDNVPGSVNLTFQAAESRTINASATDANGCFAETSIDIQVNKPFDREEICIVTVNSEGKNMIVWEKTYDAGIVSYNIYKETNKSGQYDVIGNLPVGELSVFTDDVSDPSVSSDRYRIAAVDTCGNESDPSPFHKTIHLAVSPAIPSGNNLSWDHIEIENDAGQYGTYFIYRGTGYDNMELIGSIASSKSQYTDSAPPAGQTYYQVSAKKLDACLPTGTKKELLEPYGESFSNVEDVEGTSVGMNRIQSSIRIYPNPFTESATIEFSNPDHTPRTIKITDMTGKIILEEMVTGEKIKIRKNDMPPGAYILEMNGNYIQRAIIMVL